MIYAGARGVLSQPISDIEAVLSSLGSNASTLFVILPKQDLALAKPLLSRKSASVNACWQSMLAGHM